MKTKKSLVFKKFCVSYGVDPDEVPQILSFEDACRATGNNPEAMPVVTGINERHQKRIVADYKLSIIAEALREGKDVDYNGNSAKYFAVFEVEADEKRPSGFGLSCDVYDCWFTYSTVGVRLCFHNLNVVKFFGKHFIELHKDHHLYT